MKKIAIITAFVSTLLLVATSSNATIRRVGFTASTSPVSGIDYTTFQAAHDAANVGDTIQIYPNTSPISYSATINKRLVILGAGYFYNSYTTPYTTDLLNTGLQNLAGGISNTSITIGVGSSGTYIAGFYNLSVSTSNIPDSLNNITITRNRGVSVSWDNSGVCNNWIISQCMGVSVYQSGYGASFTGNRTITNFRIENCIGYYENGSISVNLNTSPVGISSGQILNCTAGSGSFTLNANNQAVVVQNCIIETLAPTSGYLTNVTNTIFINNTTTSSASNNPVATNPGSTGNVFGVSFANNSYFLGYPNNTSGSTTLNSPDARFKLSSTSPAKNAGIIPGTATATDCGAYGGTNPYKASGIPPIPSFYKLNAPSSTATGNSYTLTFSVKSNN
ncbi:MAG: hypothetical protein ACOVO1_01775 [Chitinophagaceae bacterium]